MTNILKAVIKMANRRPVRIRMRREAGHGGVIPRGWRMAWYEPRRRVGVYFPAPAHLICRACRELAHRWRAAMAAPTIERAEVFAMQREHRERERYADEYARGYLNGWRECFRACLDVVEEEFDRGQDTWAAGALLTDSGDAPREN
jgi:hypothetical protein